MRNSILKMADSSQRLINLLPKTAYLATICGQTGCGKTGFILDLLEGPYRGFFQYSVALCPTVRHNKTYQQCPGSRRTPRSTFLTPVSDSTITCERFTMYLWANRRCISSMTAQLRRLLRRKKTCCQCLLCRAAMQGNLSGSSLKNITAFSKIFASRRAGSLSSTARTAIPLKTVCVKLGRDPFTRTAGVGACSRSRPSACSTTHTTAEI